MYCLNPTTSTYTYRVKINYPSGQNKFGWVSGQLPLKLYDYLSALRIDYFNISYQKEIHRTVELSKKDLDILALLFAQFSESQASIIQTHTLHVTEGLIYKDGRAGRTDRQFSILENYFGYRKINNYTIESLKYDSLEEWLCAEVRQASFDVILTILAKEYGMGWFDLDHLTSFRVLQGPRMLNGIPSITTKDGTVINIAQKNKGDKVLMINTCLVCESGIREYCLSREPKVLLTSEEDFNRVGGIIKDAKIS